MADDDSPADAGTTEEQQDEHRLGGAEPSEQQGPTDAEGDGIAVQAVDEAEQEQEDEQYLEAELDEAIEMLEALREDPDNIGALAVVVNTKNGLPEQMGDEDRHEDEQPDGTTWRVVNSSLDGYEDTNDVVATLAGFNDGLDQAEVPMERPSGPMGLGGILGLE